MNSRVVFDVNSGLWFDKPRPDCQFCMRCDTCNREFSIYLRKLNKLVTKFHLKYYHKHEGVRALHLCNSIDDLARDFRLIALAATKGPNDPPLEQPNLVSIFEQLFNDVYG